MSIRPIRITGDPALHTRAFEVTTWDKQLHTLVEDMIDTMKAAPGVGLAAPQVGVPLRVFVWEWTDDEGTLHKGNVVNPTLRLGRVSRKKPHPENDLEGCLSVPDFRFPLQRANSVVLTGTSLERDVVKVSATGWLARIFQHEFDHLEGLLYVDRLRWRTLFRARQDIKNEGWARPGLSWMPGRDSYEGSGHEAEEA